jgi:predicted alpha/beta hydrolase
VSEAVEVAARDGLRLACDWFPASAPAAAALIAPAMGVPRRYYRSFAEYLAERGVSTLVANYRGMDGSAPDPAARLRDWAEQDLAGAAAWLLARTACVSRTWIGHSVGAQLFGLLADPPFDRALFVAGQSGWSGGWPRRRERLAIRALWWVGVPVSTALLGYLPMRRLGQGQDVPGGVAREWASWGRHPDYVRSYADTLATDGFRTFRGPVRMVNFPDDRYAPPRTALRLGAMYRATTPEALVIAPSEVGLPAIGHFGAFRSASRAALWGGFADFAYRT